MGIEFGKHRVKQVVAKAARSTAAIKKADQEMQIVWGEVFSPGFPDSQNDFMKAEEIVAMAYGFMRKGVLTNIDTSHDGKDNGSYVVESFIARDGDPDFIPGAWVLAVKIEDPVLWDQVKKGELNGFSMEGLGVRTEGLFEIEIPDELTGETDYFEAAGIEKHNHTFIVKYSPEGEFLGGQTNRAPDGHFHKITKGTVTDDALGHGHRFSFLEGVLEFNEAA